MRTRRRTGFTLVELLVVMAIISILAALLLPALDGAMKSARMSACASRLRQNGVAHALYQGDFDGFFPLFGGEPWYQASHGWLNRFQPFWFGPSASSGLCYFTDYLESDLSAGAYKQRPLAYCPAIDWLDLAIPVSGDRMYFNSEFGGPYNATAGYFYWTGRQNLHLSQTWGDFDSLPRRHDPNELIMSEFWAKNTYYGPGPTNNALGANKLIPWFNPHVNQGCVMQPQPGFGHQLRADGHLRTPAFGLATEVKNRSQREMQYAHAVKTGTGRSKYLVDAE